MKPLVWIKASRVRRDAATKWQSLRFAATNRIGKASFATTIKL